MVVSHFTRNFLAGRRFCHAGLANAVKYHFVGFGVDEFGDFLLDCGKFALAHVELKDRIIRALAVALEQRGDFVAPFCLAHVVADDQIH